MDMPFIKDSDNNPLRIDEVDFRPGLVGISICPGKYDDFARTGPCHRDVTKDLLLVKNWGASVVVTLVEDLEMELLKVSHMPEVARKLGLSWWHFPLPDEHPLEFSGHPLFDPKNDFWSLPMALLRLFLARGGRVLVHCRGGLGRTGTMVSRLLIESGYSPDQAIELVRQARAGSVETPEQEKYLFNLPTRLAKKPNYYELISLIPPEVQGQPIKELFKNPADFSLDAWLAKVKPYLVNESS
ncbi:MAG: hypothetical protein LBP22_13905 [Deltaproteobacteria bacterium]|jgi:protein-tyrosine phosphatase|nr:hypothetical protein [Deltaproteobacteria bacterium]